MERKQEIIILLKELLGNADKAIDGNQHASIKNSDPILESCENVVAISKQIETYLAEIYTLS